MSKAPSTFLFGKAGSFIRTKVLQLSGNRQQTVHYFCPSWLGNKNSENTKINLSNDDHRKEEIKLLNNSNSSSNQTIHHVLDQESNAEKKEFTIFFPGDIQLRLCEFMKRLQVDYPFEESEFGDDENGRVMEVYYENVLDILYRKYPETSGLVIVQPNVLDLSSFVYEYENFYVKGNANAVLFEILDNLFPNEGFGRAAAMDKEHVQINFVAFSKGCVALNSILSETANCANYLEKNVQYLNDAQGDYIHWDEKPNKLVQPCYKITLEKNGGRNLNREEMERCVGLLKYNLKSIHFVDCHRFITSENLLTTICKILEPRINTDEFKLKVHQTPLINEDNQFRKHIKYESDMFIKILKKIYSGGKSLPCPFLSYQYYYDELEGNVNSFLLHFRVLSDFE